MKVLYANTTLPPLHFGGSEVYCMGLAKTMPSLGIETAAVCIESWSDGDHRTQFRRAETYNGVRIHRLYSNEHWEPVSTLWTGNSFYIQEFERILDEEKPDLVHVMAHLRLAKLISIARERNIPVVLTGVDFSPFCGRSSLVQWDNNVCEGKAEIGKCRDCLAFARGLNPAHWEGRASRAWDAVSWLDEGSRDRIYRIAAKFKTQGMGRVRFYDEWGHRTAQRIIGHVPELFGSLSRVFAPSPIMREMWEKNGYPPERIVDFPYGVDLQRLPTGRTKTHSKEFRFGFIGRFNGLKNLRTLLEAFSLIEGKAPISLSLFGAEDFWDHGNHEIADLKRMAEKCTGLHFKGRLDRSEIGQAYEEIDCLVVPSAWYENAPISMMEAQHFGTPIICTDLPGMTCLVQHEVNGLLFRNKSARGLALQMYRMATEPQLYDRLRSNAIPIQTIEENARALLPHYLEVMEKDLPSESDQSRKQLPGIGSAAEFDLMALAEGKKPDSYASLEAILRNALEEFGVDSLDVVQLDSSASTAFGWAVSEGLCRVKSVDLPAETPLNFSGEPVGDIPDGGFHLAFAAEALCETEFPVTAFQRLAAMVQPGGYICVQHCSQGESLPETAQHLRWQLWDEEGTILVGDPARKSWRLDQGQRLETVFQESVTDDEAGTRIQIVFRKPASVPAVVIP